MLPAGVLGAREFGLMKKTAYVINVARGPIWDEKALCSALKEGKIAGAGSDVYEVEPSSKDLPPSTLRKFYWHPSHGHSYGGGFKANQPGGGGCPEGSGWERAELSVNRPERSNR